jgi:hypothetical protein
MDPDYEVGSDLEDRKATSEGEIVLDEKVV